MFKNHPDASGGVSFFGYKASSAFLDMTVSLAYQGTMASLSLFLLLPALLYAYCIL